MLTALTAGLLSGIALMPPQIRGEDAIGIASRFVRDYGVQGQVKVVSCSRLDRQTAQGGYVWHLSMVRAPNTEFSVGITTAGSLIWFERSGGGNYEPSKPSAEWRRDALKHANKLLLKLKPKWTVEQPKDDLMRFGQDRFFFPITVNGKRFVGRPIGYTFELAGPKFDLQRFSQVESVPRVNVAIAAITSEQATAVFKATYPSDPDLSKKGSTQHRFEGKPQLVYYSDYEHPESARLVWYQKIAYAHNRGIGVSGTSFGAIVDAVTGKHIKTRNRLS